MAETLEKFPVWGLLPKKETGVLSFLTKYPSYDGRGTVIGIFDSGVDPGAPGLQVTSDGKPKIIQRFDCSGCGDVITSTVVEPTDGVIKGLTGRSLKIPNTWKNPSNKFHIGIKHAFDLYPEKLRDKVKTEYKEKNWDEKHREIFSQTIKELSYFDNKSNNTLSETEKITKENLEAKVELLINFEKKFNDIGPIYDCILFNDGEKWMCCVDTSEKGDLENCPTIGEYGITHEYAALNEFDNLNFSFNVYDNGNLLELVGLASSHGTHVAAIAAANFPENPEQNGIAPGAQIVSFSIADGRIGCMETGTATVRAMIKLMELTKTQPIHVINMSYGEHGHWSDSGRVGDLMAEIVNNYGVVWVASAGNHGPALNTIGVPPDISQECIIGVGAYVSPDMMVAEYSMREKLPGMPYTWSSRGPTMDGGMGVTICAPGGAITSVPNFTLRFSQLLNGTSMSAPHVSGAVSVLLSGILQKNLEYSPFSVKRAMEVSATFLDGVEVFAQGNGLLNVEKTFDHLCTYQDAQERDVRFHVSCGSHNGKGILIRSLMPHKNHSFNVSVEPFFLDSDNTPAEKKINFNVRLALVCDSTYVNYPTYLDLANLARVFVIKVDTSALPVGVHHTYIRAYDSTCIEKGALFKIPITVIIPQEVLPPKYVLNYNNVLFTPNTLKRQFIHVPKNATWFTLNISTKEVDKVGRFMVHVLQVLPRRSCKSIDTNKTITLNSNSDITMGFQVKSEMTLEVVIAKYWANIGDIIVDYNIAFHGIKPNQPSITMHAADGIHSVEVTTLNGEEILPSLVLKNSVQVLRPAEFNVNSLGKRDIIPPSRQIYELVLVYNFTLNKGTEVTPNFALLSDVLYESEFESQFWMLYDNNKQLISCGDAYPSMYSVKLEKGDYTIRLQVRHDKKEYLDKMTDVPLLLQQKLSSSISVDVYSTFQQAVTYGKKASIAHSLYPIVCPYYISPLPSDKFPSKTNNAAQYLTGYITFVKDDLGKKIDTYPFKYILVEGSMNKKSSSNNEKDKDKTKLDEFNEAVREHKINWISKMDPPNVGKLYSDLCKEYPDNMQLHAAYLQVLDPLDAKHALPIIEDNECRSNKEKDHLQQVIKICDNVINFVNETEVLAYIATKADLRPDAAKIKTQMDHQKNALIEALTHKGVALSNLFLLKQDSSQEDLEEIVKIWKSLGKFVDVNDLKAMNGNVLYFAVWYSLVHKLYGKTLRYLMKLLEDKPSKELEEKVKDFCALNKWVHVRNHILRLLPSKYPESYRPF